MNITDLLGRTVRQSESAKYLGVCTDVLIDVATAQIKYVLIHLADGLERVPALLSLARVTWADGDCIADLTDEELAEYRDAASSDDAQGPVDLTAMPPLFIGPFGYTVAPLAASAWINAVAGGDDGYRPAVDKTHKDWFWFATLRGVPLFDASGPLGGLEDVTLDPDTLDCTELVARNAAGDAAFYAFDDLRNVTRQSDSIILETSEIPAYSGEALRR